MQQPGRLRRGARAPHRVLVRASARPPLALRCWRGRASRRAVRRHRLRPPRGPPQLRTLLQRLGSSSVASAPASRPIAAAARSQRMLPRSHSRARDGVLVCVFAHAGPRTPPATTTLVRRKHQRPPPLLVRSTAAPDGGRFSVLPARARAGVRRRGLRLVELLGKGSPDQYKGSVREPSPPPKKLCRAARAHLSTRSRWRQHRRSRCSELRACSASP